MNGRKVDIGTSREGVTFIFTDDGLLEINAWRARWDERTSVVVGPGDMRDLAQQLDEWLGR